MNAPVLRVSGASKRFGATQALRGASLELMPGSIHALLGGNGSGKSTLLKALAGVQPADEGTLEIGGTAIPLASMTPSKARELGLRFVHQQPSVFPSLSVAENLAIGAAGFDLTLGWRVQWPQTRRRAQEVLNRFQIDVHPDVELSELNPATQTMVAIARALQDLENASDGILLLDEPTASLPDHEANLVLEAMNRYAAAGQTIVYVTHRLEEVFAAADRATLLVDGRVITTVAPQEVSHADLVELIMGRAVEQVDKRSGPVDGPVVLEVSCLSAGPLEDFSVQARAGEIVGVTGLIGSGRSSLLKALFGVLPRRSGTVAIQGAALRVNTPRDAIAAGLSYVPENRAADAAFAHLSLLQNLSIANVGKYWSHARLQHRQERREANNLLEEFLIKAESVEGPMAELSGGNQQKAILARWLQRRPKVLLLDEPTQGVDVGARAEIYGHIRRAVDTGSVALVASSDTEELEAICDRVVVLRKGRRVAELSGDELTSANMQRLSHSDSSSEGEKR
ncbi:sugar ABC transporter ATP-binding protein [Nocardioides sp. AN3]